MAQQLDWSILPDDLVAGNVLPTTEYKYDLYNLTTKEAICYGERTIGINLTWTDPSKSTNLRFQKQSGENSPIKFDEPIAIHVRGGKWLVYKVRDEGVNLGWSDTPKFEWLFKGGVAGAPVISGNQLGLYSTVENDHIMYEKRDWGINLKWYKDKGEHDTWTTLGTVAGDAIKIGGTIAALL